jgi:outer membrane protein assembly factor BamB
MRAAPLAQSADSLRYWPQWRGPYASGVSTTADPPLEWSETKNIKWKVEVPGRGSATPVVWNDRLFVLTAVPVGVSGAAQHEPRGGLRARGVHRFLVLAIDRNTGRTLWERVAAEAEPHEASHTDNGTWASSSPITDGESVFAYFESFGLYAYDMNGTLKWKKDLGDKRMRNQFGEGSTPALHGNTIVIVWDHLNGDGSFIVALDKSDGRELWRVARTEIDTWATPLILEVNGRPQVIVPAMTRNRSYDLATGAVVWESDGLTMNPIPSPVYADGMVFLMSGFQGNDLKAIRVADARGNIDNTPNVVWTLNRDTPYVPSPVLVDGTLYFLKTNSGILSAFDAKTGKPHYQNQRLDGVPTCSRRRPRPRAHLHPRPRRDHDRHPVGPSYEVLAKNTLDDGFDASPAMVDTELFLRGQKFLYCISQTP